MDKSFQIAIGVCVVVFFITLNLFFREQVQRGARDAWQFVAGSSVQVTPVTNSAAAPASTPEPKAKPAPSAKRHAARQVADDEPSKTEIPVAAPKPDPPMPPPFPIASQLKAGMSRREVMNRFGVPTFTASWSQDGSLAEKFIYTREARVTAVILRDGEVVTSRTGPYDPWAKSRWWQAGQGDRGAQ